MKKEIAFASLAMVGASLAQASAQNPILITNPLQEFPAMSWQGYEPRKKRNRVKPLIDKVATKRRKANRAAKKARKNNR